MIDTEQLTNPQAWRLAMRLEPDLLTAMLYGADRDRPREVRTYPLDPGRHLQTLRDTIYDHPMLLSDFASTALIAATPTHAVIPAAAAALERTVMERTFPAEAAGLRTHLTTMGTGDAILLTGLPADTDNFLSRTFPSLTITGPLAVLATYFSSRFTAGGNGLRLYALLRPRGVDIVALDRQSLRAAVSHETAAPVDAAYFVMAAMQQLGAPAQETEIFIGGLTAPRNEVMALLRNYVPAVMPVIIPSTAMPDASVPFDLNIYPLL